MVARKWYFVITCPKCQHRYADGVVDAIDSPLVRKIISAVTIDHFAALNKILNRSRRPFVVARRRQRALPQSESLFRRLRR